MQKVDKGALLGTNPYNSQKEWDDEGKTGEAFVSADDSMAYVKKTKTVVLDKVETTEQPQQEEATPPEDAKFKKVDYKKRYDDLKKHYDSKVNEFKTKEADLRQQVEKSAPKYTPPTTPEELEKFKKDNPSVYNLVETVAHMQSSRELDNLQKELSQVKEALAYTEAEKAYATLKSKVPDFEQIRQSEDFHHWAEQQPEQIQDWVYRNSTNVELAAKAINLYKADRGMATPQEKQATSSYNQAADYVPARRTSEEPVPKTGKVWTREEIGSLSSRQYEQYRDEIDQAFAEGRVSM